MATERTDIGQDDKGQDATQEDTCVFMVHGVPEDLKRQFKIKCVEQGITMREGCIQALQFYLGSETEEVGRVLSECKK
jgi:hypothetical protein